MGAPLEARNTWGGTVLDSTVWFARHAPVAGVDPVAIDPLQPVLVAVTPRLRQRQAQRAAGLGATCILNPFYRGPR